MSLRSMMIESGDGSAIDVVGCAAPPMEALKLCLQFVEALYTIFCNRDEIEGEVLLILQLQVPGGRV